ncbi:hypothetical protein [Aliiglaciecola sp. NS0011-25]|uniref:hypothetical protein n=1 Tax=Aliiglaciecola sp. NS0011-25 TaxID=3127654 RepID=UPI0031093AE1
MKKQHQELLVSPSHIVSYVPSPFASWMQGLCVNQPQSQPLRNHALRKQAQPPFTCLAEHKTNTKNMQLFSALKQVTATIFQWLLKGNATNAFSTETRRHVQRIFLLDKKS